ncbi:LemA family protein [Phascolarctobacterium succinatutens]|uniref:LemA family protein n=1 Tax=Phascolarctobacterium succinatutens TaxID=626940 RepID=UPI00402923E9
MLSSLTKYSDTINKLQELLEGYVGHEKLVVLKVSDNIVEMTKATSNAMAHIQGLVQTYPDIKANGTYHKLMDEVSYIQEEINRSRIIYNEAVASYNSKRNSLPEALYAGALGFPEAPFYDPENISAVQEFKTDDGTIVKEMLKRGTDNTVAVVKNAKDNISHKIEEVQQKHDKGNE